ncbi:MAG: precorrin-8X methylmutase [Clostridia bacterium]|nr:precorrin-8X methylmutase [Clostridia bacterium]
MLNNIENVVPGEIERRSFEIISEILGNRTLDPRWERVIKRVIHTTADFDYLDNLKFSEDAVEKGKSAMKSGFNVVTDTKMAAAGINKKRIGTYGGQVVCFMDDEEISQRAKERNVTRASLCMERAALDEKNKIYVIGNAPTALIRLCELIHDKKVFPDLVVGVPVGFVNVVESKELLKEAKVPYILSEGRKGGSNVAAAIVNAILYMVE